VSLDTTIQISAADGYPLGATIYGAGKSAHSSRVAIVNCATGVKASYYSRYARFLAAHGYIAITYDYRGIGASRPASLRKLKASKFDWGNKDFEGVLNWAAQEFPSAKLAVVGHSIGGTVPGFSASNSRIDRMLTVGAQFAYWKDYALRARYPMFLKWHIFMPLVTRLFGYFPGRRLGWLEDLPAGVAYEWAFRKATLGEEPGKHIDLHEPRHGSAKPARYFSSLRCPVLAYSITDDPYATPAAVLRLLAYYTGCDRSHVVVRPDELHLQEIGHFAFFHERFRDTLWRETLTWLDSGRSPRTVTHHFAAAG
jgi:predicted alpha/beta hydrolase